MKKTMKRFVFLLVVSASVEVVWSSSENPQMENANIDMSNDDDIESLRQMKSDLLKEISYLEEENNSLRSDNSALENLRNSGNAFERMTWGHHNLSDIRISDCADLLLFGVTTSGVYTIYPFLCGCATPMRVYCDMETDGGGWTVIMDRRQQETQLNFNRSWKDYKRGFGRPHREHWLGNENIYKLTSSRVYSLRMDIERTDGDSKSAVYPTFKLENEALRYKLILGARSTESTNIYDCFYYNRNRYFTTYDKDFDSNTGVNCAAMTGGGFWYYDCRTHSPPTGVYEGALNNTCYKSTVYQLASLQMKIRPNICGLTSKTIDFANSECDDC